MSKRQVVGSVSDWPWSGVLKDLFRQIHDKSITLEQIKSIVSGNENKFTKLISGGADLFLDAVDGTETLVDAVEYFDVIDKCFKEWGLNERAAETPKTPVAVYEMIGNATYPEMFSKLNADVKKICLTQHQIKNFVMKYSVWLRKDKHSTFFLCEVNGHFFVVDVLRLNFNSYRGVYVRHFGRSRIWDAESRRRIVVPEL